MNLKELAEHLQLSQTTVSRALNGYPEVALRTRQRVAEAASQMGYRPNHAARHLATGETKVIAVVMRMTFAQPADPHYAEFLSGVGDAGLRHGYDVLLCPATEQNEEATYRRIAQSGQADGIILSSPLVGDSRLPLLESLGLPYILHGRVTNGPAGHAFVDIDNEGAFFDATRLLLKLGHRRIGLINGPAGMTFADNRAEGVTRALRDAGLALDPVLSVRAQMTDATGMVETERMLMRPEPPTAILCSSLFIALGAIRAINRAGLVVGRDISLIAHDDVIPFLKPDNFSVPLTTTRSSIRKAGQRVAEHLIARLAAPDTPAPNEIWPVDLVVRDSIGALVPA